SRRRHTRCLSDWSSDVCSSDLYPDKLGVWLDASEGPEAIAGDLQRFALIAVNFPKFGDGRGYSIARLLRERYGYQGELRAIGDEIGRASCRESGGVRGGGRR